jgi:hypothetical protein
VVQVTLRRWEELDGVKRQLTHQLLPGVIGLHRRQFAAREARWYSTYGEQEECRLARRADTAGLQPQAD